MPLRTSLLTFSCSWLAFSAFAAGCSEQDATILEADRPLLPQPPSAEPSGSVALAITSGEIGVSSLRFTVRDAEGRVVQDGARELASSEAALSLDLDLPVGEDYSLELRAESEGSVECVGEASFDVREGVTLDLAVALACEAAGGVRVVGTLLPPEACPAVELTALEAPLPVGESVRLRATASAGEATTFAWASSGGKLDASLAAAATFQCTEPGPVTLTLTATDNGCTDTASTVIDCAATASACADLGSTCHVVDPGSGTLHGCHELGHGGDEEACSIGRASCIDACGTELCSVLGSLCHEVDPGSGPLHDCHELGHGGIPTACFERGRECFDLCTEARAAASVPIEIAFEAKVGDEDFACGQVYADVNGSGLDAEPQDLRFFVSEVRLIDASGAQEPVIIDTLAPWQLPEVALLDFEDASGLCGSGTTDTNTTLKGRVFPGDYVGVAFKVSVPEALNHDDPALAPAPLELGSMSWGWLLGYRFLRAELAPVVAEGEVAGLGLVHLGSTACTGNPQAGTVVCSNPNRNEVVLDGFDAATNSIVADIGALFAESDLSVDSSCHSTGEFCGDPFQSLGIDFATGTPSAEQTFFRVE